jgi:hypothetical protein
MVIDYAGGVKVNNDPYDNGIPKYSTAQDIYDALCELVQTEEMNILSEIGADVSWENQGYYYTDKGNTLKEKFEQLSDCGDKMWLMNLAIMQIDQTEIHDLVYESLINSDLAKRIGFKKLFVEHMLNDRVYLYDAVVELYEAELQELNRFDNYEMLCAFNRAMDANGTPLYGITPYPIFANRLAEKVHNLQLAQETKLITECRAHLTAYDDFIFGLRVNQALHERQEQMYKQKVAELQAAYDEKLKLLLVAADRAGLLPILIAEQGLLIEKEVQS